MMEAKISKLPPLALFATAAVILVFGIATGITASVYSYTFNDVFLELGTVLILLAAVFVILIVKAVICVLDLRTGLKAGDGTLEVKYLKKLKLTSRTVGLSEIKRTVCTQTLFEKIVKQGTIHIFTADKKPIRLRHIVNVAEVYGYLETTGETNENED